MGPVDRRKREIRYSILFLYECLGISTFPWTSGPSTELSWGRGGERIWRPNNPLDVSKEVGVTETCLGATQSQTRSVEVCTRVHDSPGNHPSVWSLCQPTSTIVKGNL